MLSKGAVSTETVLYTECTLRKYNTQTIRLTVQASLSDKDRQEHHGQDNRKCTALFEIR